MDNLAGKSMMITGAARGVGRGIALAGARAGAKLWLVDRDEAALKETAEECRGAESVETLTLDITDVEAVRAQIAVLGPIDVLVNNAGIMQTKSFFEIEEEDWDRVLAVNLKAAFFLSQAVGKKMMEQKQGSIVNIASVAARWPRPLAMPYGVSKSGVLSLTRSMAAFFGEHGVRVNAVCPGAMDTEMLQRIGQERAHLFGGSPEEAILDYVGPIPMGRLGQPTDVAEAVLFLASDQARYITGQSLNVCGGWQMV